MLGTLSLVKPTKLEITLFGYVNQLMSSIPNSLEIELKNIEKLIRIGQNNFRKTV